MTYIQIALIQSLKYSPHLYASPKYSCLQSCLAASCSTCSMPGQWFTYPGMISQNWMLKLEETPIFGSRNDGFRFGFFLQSIESTIIYKWLWRYGSWHPATRKIAEIHGYSSNQTVKRRLTHPQTCGTCCCKTSKTSGLTCSGKLGYRSEGGFLFCLDLS